jgi:hypothetical protein
MKKSLINLVSPNIKALGLPMVILLVLLFLSLISYRIASSKLSIQNTELKNAKIDEKVLESKKNILTQIEGQIGSYADTVALALPDKNPVVTMVSQIKNLAAVKNISLNDIKGGSESPPQGDLSYIDINLTAEGPIFAVVDFLKSLEGIAPLSTLERAKINQSGASARAEISVRSYFSPYPQLLPQITEQVSDFTADEKDILTKLTQLTKPIFINLIPQQPEIRPSPFD